MTEHAIGIDAVMADATPDQRRVFDAIAAGPRGSVPSPFLAMLDAPDVAEAVQQVGVVIRYGSSMDASHRELAILATASAVGCQYEWDYHAPIARRSGTPDAAIAATRPGGISPPDKPWKTIVDLTTAVAREHRVDEALLSDALARFGRQGVTELVAIAGYYSLLANFIIIGGFDADI